MSRVELLRILRFSTVGATVAAIYFVLFLVLRRYGLYAPIASVVSFIVAVAFQYLAQTFWTFGRKVRDGSQVGRFVAVILTGLAISTFLSGYVGPALGLPDAVSAAVVVVLLPIMNYVAFTVWVYRDEDRRRSSQSGAQR